MSLWQSNFPTVHTSLRTLQPVDPKELNCVTLSQQDAELLEKDSRKQSGCPQWFKAREVRIAVSNSGKCFLSANPGQIP